MFDRDVQSSSAACTVGLIEAVVRYVASLGHEEVVNFILYTYS
jgi:hypothetical protein